MAITPYLYYEDVAAAIAWLTKAFGFKRYGRPMKDAHGEVVHGAMQFGDAVFMLGCPPGGKYRNPKRLGQATQSLYVEVADVDRHFARARKVPGGRVLEEPEDTGYGARRCGIADPEGHEWYFARS